MRIRSFVVNLSSLLLLSMLLCSCFGARKFQEDQYNAREKDKQAFVVTKDGKMIEANEAVLRSPLFGKSTIELDKETKIPVKEVKAYQNKSAYYETVNGQFAPRFKKGLINMFVTTEIYTDWSQGPNGRSTPRTRTRTIYWMQKGSGDIKRFSPDLTIEYVQDYAPSMEFIDQYLATKKKTTMWSWINTGAVIGGLLLAGTTGIRNDQVTATGYAGLGLFAGGLVNGFVNKIRKVKNGANLELAIDAYNYQTVKKRR